MTTTMQSQAPALMKIDVHVIVTGQASHADDDSLPGIYGHEVSLSRPVDLANLTPAEKSEIAELVLDEFHDKQGIECLEDFNIEVRLSDGTVLEQLEEDLADFNLVDNVDHLGKIDGEAASAETPRRG